MENNGGVVVAPVGNGGENLSVAPSDRAPLTAVPEVVTVGAVAPISERKTCIDRSRSIIPAAYTNYGTAAVDLVAPGGETSPHRQNGIFSTSLNFQFDFEASKSRDNDMGSQSPSYAWWEGTSFAGPHVAGTAALLAALGPDRPPQNIRRIIRSSAAVIPDSEDKFYGSVVLDL